MASSSAELSATNQQISTNSEETSTQPQVVSESAQKVSQNLQGLSAGAEQMAATIQSIATKASEFRIIGEASDGLQAVQLAGQLQPDLGLLDIGLPMLNGIEAARQIRDVSAASKILFVSENWTADIVEEALSTDARAYIVKSDATGELLSAIRAVLEGNRFVSSSVAGYRPHRSPKQDYSAFTEPQMLPTSGHHEVGFYSQHRQLVDHVTGSPQRLSMRGMRPSSSPPSHTGKPCFPT